MKYFISIWNFYLSSIFTFAVLSDPFWYQELSHIGTQVVEKGCGNIYQKRYILWECINFEEKPGIKLIYLLIYHNLSIFIVVHFPACRDLILSAVGAVPNKYVSIKTIFTIANSTSLTQLRNFDLNILVHHY